MREIISQADIEEALGKIETCSAIGCLLPAEESGLCPLHFKATPKERRKIEVTSRPPETEREELKEAELREKQDIDNRGLISELEENERSEHLIDYEKVLDDLMSRYAEMGIAIQQVRRILKEQGKDPDA